MGNFTSHDPTCTLVVSDHLMMDQLAMFWILKSLNLVGKPSFCTILAYFRAASRESSSDLAPVQTLQKTIKSAYGWLSHHLAGAEDEGSGAGLADPHDHRREPLGVELGITGMQRDLFQVQLDTHVDGAAIMRHSGKLHLATLYLTIFCSWGMMSVVEGC